MRTMSSLTKPLCVIPTVLNDVNNSIITLNDDSVWAVLSSVSFFDWIDCVKSKCTKEVSLCFYWDWDVLGVDLMAIDGRKMGCTSWVSSRVITSILIFLNKRGIGSRLHIHTQSLQEIVQMVHKCFYPSYHSCRD